MTTIDLTYLLSLGNNDKLFVADMLQTYIEESSSDLEGLEKAYSENNIARIAFLIHRMKAAFRMLGLVQLFELAESLEKQCKEENIELSVLQQYIEPINQQTLHSFEEAQSWISQNT